MKYAKKKSPKVAIITICALVAVALGICAIIFIPKIVNKQNTSSDVKNGTNYSAPSDDQQKAGDQAKEDFLNKQNQASQNTNSQTNNANKAINVSISTKGQNGSTYSIRTIIDTLDDNGQCVLTMKKSGQTDYTQTVGTQILSSYSVCKGFDIPTSNLTTGDWQLTINYQGISGQGSVQQTVTIQ